MKTSVIAFFLLISMLGSAFAQSLAQTQSKPRAIDCYCTDSVGERKELGEEICLFVDGRAFIARCEMSLNSPMWREKSEGCPASSLLGGSRFSSLFGVLLE